MDSEQSRVQNSAQMRAPSSKETSQNVWENIRIFNNTCKNLSFVEREKVIMMLKMHERRAESLIGYFKEKSITQEMFIEGINQLLLNKHLTQHKPINPEKMSQKPHSCEPQINAKVVTCDLNASSQETAVPLIQIDLGFGVPGKLENKDASPKPQATALSKLLKRTDCAISTAETVPGMSNQNNSKILKQREGNLSVHKIRSSTCNGETKTIKAKPSSNVFGTSHLNKPNPAMVKKAAQVKKQSKPAPSNKGQLNNINKENPMKQKAILTGNSNSNLLIERASTTPVSTPFQINRLLNRLTSPRDIVESRSQTSPTTPTNLKDQLVKQKETLSYNNLDYSSRSKDSLQDTSIINLSSPPPHNNKFSKANGQHNTIRVSELLNPSPSVDSGAKFISRTQAVNPLNELYTREEFQGTEPEFLLSLGINPHNGHFLNCGQRYLHNRFPSANPDKGNREDSTLDHQRLDTFIQPPDVDISTAEDQFNDDDSQLNTEPYTDNMEENVSKFLSPNTRKFANPVPHSYRLPTETDAQYTERMSLKDVVMVNYKGNDEYCYRQGSQQRSSQDSYQNSSLNKFSLRNEELRGSFGFKSPSADTESFGHNQEQNWNMEIRNQNLNQGTKAGDRGYGTQASFTYSKETQETQHSNNSNMRINISEFRNSFLRTYESDLVVLEEPSCMEKSNLTTFRKAESVSALLNLSADTLEAPEGQLTKSKSQKAELVVDQKEEVFDFNPNNLSEKTKSILSSIVNNITLEKNVPNLSRHLRKHSASQSSNSEVIPKTTSRTLLDITGSVDEWKAESNVTSETPNKDNNTNRYLVAQEAPQLGQVLEEELDTSRNPVLYDDQDHISFSASNNGYVTNLAGPKGFDKRDILNLIQNPENIDGDDDYYSYSNREELRSKHNCTPNDQPETINYTNNFEYQTEFNQIAQVQTPDYGYKFESRLTKEDTEGKTQKNIQKCFLASFGGEENLLRSNEMEQDAEHFSNETLDNHNLCSPEDNSTKNQDTLSAKLLGKRDSHGSQEQRISYRGSFDLHDNQTDRSKISIIELRQAEGSELDNSIFKNEGEMLKESLLPSRTNSKDAVAYSKGDLSSNTQRTATTYSERLNTQSLKESLYQQERPSTLGERSSYSVVRMEDRLVSIHILKKFCDRNGVFAEDLVDEIFRYLNENFVNKNYFVQILTNYLNCFPLISQAIRHQDVSNKIFEICDKNSDGIISVNDLGEGCLLFCQKRVNSQSNEKLLYGLLDPENRGFVLEGDILNLLTKAQCLALRDQGKYSEMREDMEAPEDEAIRIVKELDKERRGIISYWDIFVWKDTFHFSQVIERVHKYASTLQSVTSLRQSALQETKPAVEKVTKSSIQQIEEKIPQKEVQRVFEDGGYLESAPSMGPKTEEDDCADNGRIQVVEILSSTNWEENKMQNREEIYEDEPEDSNLHLSPPRSRSSWQRPRYTLSTIYENSLSRLEAEDHSPFKNNISQAHHCDSERRSLKTRSVELKSANKENWNLPEQNAFDSENKDDGKESASKTLSARNRYSNSASKAMDTRESEVIFAGSTPRRTRRALASVEGIYANSLTKYGAQLEF